MRHGMRGLIEALETRVIDCAFAASGAIDARVLRASGALSDFDVHRNVSYRAQEASPAHLLDIYHPKANAGLRPCVFYVHGGSFRILSKESHSRLALRFAQFGAVVFNINYRLAPRHPFPAAIQDVCRAYLWVRDNAHRFGGQADSIIVAGESAGANLVTALTVASHYSRPEPWAAEVYDQPLAIRAVLPSCGILQVTDSGRFHRANPNLSKLAARRICRSCLDYLGEPRGSVREFTLADPLCVLEATPPSRPLPPFLVQAGSADPIVQDTRRLEAALRARGVPHTAVYYDRQPHAFQALAWRPAAKKFWSDTHEFLARQGAFRS